MADKHTPVDPDGARVHQRAEELLARLGVDATNADAYVAAVDLLGGSGAPRDEELDDRLEAAEALHDLAQFDLHERGLSDDEQAYLERMAGLERETGLQYYDRKAMR